VGQQQLLLIVVGLVIVGLCTMIAGSLYSAHSVTSNRDGVVSDLTTLAWMAQTYYQRPVSIGGGNHSFTGWTIPSQLATTGNGVYSVTVSNSTVTFVGVGTQTGNDGSNPVKVTMVVAPTSINSTSINN
jgi:hypothetical protein